MYAPATGNAGVEATTYGDLPQHTNEMPGYSGLAVVLHTTETVGMPSYSNGDSAPHYTYDAKNRKWWYHEPSVTQSVGTMRGHSTGGHVNCKAIQVEIIAYSDKSVADGHSDRLWVGDFTEEQYEDLADFYAWCMNEFGVAYAYYGPDDFRSWKYGTGSQYRMSWSDWYAFSGLTAHGAAPGNTHWNTGELNLRHITALADEEPTPPPNPPEEGMFPLEYGDGVEGGDRPHKNEDVRFYQTILRRLGHDIGEKIHGEYDDLMVAALESEFPGKNNQRLTGYRAWMLQQYYHDRNVGEDSSRSWSIGITENADDDPDPDGPEPDEYATEGGEV